MATLAWGGQQQGAAIDMLVGAPGARPAEHRMSEQLRQMTRLPLSGPEWGASVAGALGVVLLFAAYATTWSTVSYSIGRTGQTATSTGTTRNIEYGISGMSAVGTIFVLGSMLLVVVVGITLAAPARIRPMLRAGSAAGAVALIGLVIVIKNRLDIGAAQYNAMTLFDAGEVSDVAAGRARLEATAGPGVYFAFGALALLGIAAILAYRRVSTRESRHQSREPRY